MTADVTAADDDLRTVPFSVAVGVVAELRAHAARYVNRKIRQLSAEFLRVVLAVIVVEFRRHCDIVIVRPLPIPPRRQYRRVIQPVCEELTSRYEANSTRGRTDE
jgi:hypothetical protein